MKKKRNCLMIVLITALAAVMMTAMVPQAAFAADSGITMHKAGERCQQDNGAYSFANQDRVNEKSDGYVKGHFWRILSDK